ncbi:glycosyltransferase [Flavobacterium columnare]|uniref:Glycosyltransferase n=1 Tax=Flavobacterium columnare TaxID=996 RepID=A0AA94JPU6_9FLAO|nr:glycosyltransferase [Flavobacterium columnare]MCH4829051.1 glycosyltransferase [Flavobacterium columnare]MCH4833827.1 glycosyltransferase [Flavobacterium columnare]
MKVLHVINSLDMGGAEKLVAELLPIFNEFGVESELLLLNGKQTEIKNILQENGITIYDLGMINIYNPMSVFKLIKYLKNYDIVNVHLFPSLYFIALAIFFIRKNERPLLVFTEHNTMNRRIESKLFSWIDKIIYSFYKRIICITNEVEDIFKKHLGGCKNRFVVIENGIDLDKINSYKPNTLEISNLKHELGIIEKDIIITQVSAFRDQKDQVTVINALKFLPDNYKVIFLGTGKNIQVCKDLVRQLELEERVYFLGVKENVCDYFEISKFIVLSSHYEGLSLSSIEGMASGKPFIASNVPGLKDIVFNAGILFEKSDSEDLAKKIILLNKDVDLYNEVVQKCKKRASKYSIKDTAKRYIEIYNSILS